MSLEEGRIDPTITSELDEVLALLEAHLANVPQPDFRLFAGIDMLRRTRRLADSSTDPLPRRYAVICTNIRTFFLHRRADGMLALPLPEHVERKLFALSERANALSAGS